MLQAKGLRANSLAEYAVHWLIERLSTRLSPLLEAATRRHRRCHEPECPPELSLAEQLAIAPTHYSAVLLALTLEDARLGMDDASEPNRKARALLQFAECHAPDVVEAMERSDGRDFAHALEELEVQSDEPWHLLRMRRKPPEEEGYFAFLSRPWLEVNGLARSYDRGPDLRPEARAIWFNGTVPFDCLEIMPVPSDWAIG
ncbi:hypothetical protein CR51_36070 [Caballeronia megalochromosomata]|nr:hypothetical protein CR51_36070 [Caballeronia megalochromosomata]